MYSESHRHLIGETPVYPSSVLKNPTPTATEPDSYEYVEEPNHYNRNGVRVQTVIEAYELSWNLGNVIKYVLRAGSKPNTPTLKDLKKALQYLNFEIDRLTRGTDEHIPDN